MDVTTNMDTPANNSTTTTTDNNQVLNQDRNDNELSNVISPSSENLENCNLPRTDPTFPASEAIACSSSSAQDTQTPQIASNDNMNNQETDLAAITMMSEEGIMENSTSSAASSSTNSNNNNNNNNNTASTAIVTNDDATKSSESSSTATAASSVNDADPAAAKDVAQPKASASSSSSSTASNQFVTPQKPAENKSILLHLGSTSASSALSQKRQKKRNKSSKCLGQSMHGHDSSSSLSNIKTSLSMTSLPPDEQQESRDGINAKLKVERPYNSLKVSLSLCPFICSPTLC